MKPPSAGEDNLRMQMYNYIREHPAAHILEMAQAFNLSHPTVMYHLELMQDEGYLVSTLWGKRRVHFDTQAHFNAWEREVLALLAQNEARSILEHIAAQPGTFPREIAQVLGVSDTTVKRYVPELLRLNLVTEEEGFRRRLSLSRNFEKRGAQLAEKLIPGTQAWHRLAALLPASDASSPQVVEATLTETPKNL
jgi:predicted transcriptional regulator